MADVDPRNVAAVLLRRARRRRDWTQAELARRAGMPASQLCAYESSTKQPSVATLARILEVAGVDLTQRSHEDERRRQARELLDVLSLVDAMPARSRANETAFGPFRKMVRR